MAGPEFPRLLAQLGSGGLQGPASSYLLFGPRNVPEAKPTQTTASF